MRENKNIGLLIFDIDGVLTKSRLAKLSYKLKIYKFRTLHKFCLWFYQAIISSVFPDKIDSCAKARLFYFYMSGIQLGLATDRSRISTLKLLQRSDINSDIFRIIICRDNFRPYTPFACSPEPKPHIKYAMALRNHIRLACFDEKEVLIIDDMKDFRYALQRVGLKAVGPGAT